MQFTSPQFLLFLALTACLFGILPVRLRLLLLFAASYAYYATWHPLLAFGLLGWTAFAYFAARYVHDADSESAAGRVTYAVAGVLIFYLAIFKFSQSLHWGWVIPLGISYYTFKLVSYLLDVYRKQTPPERNFIRMAVFVAFFPQILAGPIQRGGSLLPQLKDLQRPRQAQVLEGLSRILIGFLRKLVIADNLGRLVDYGFAPGATHAQCWIAYYLFPLQLYADFAGLTDVAVGAALLFGIRSPENFALPFFGASISEYWRRWHMSLTEWLRDYVFMPLRMGTRNWGQVGLAISITVNMVLVAVWHAFSWNFLIFGLIHSVFLVIDALSLQRRRRFYKRHAGVDRFLNRVGPFGTYHLVAFASIFVRAASFDEGIRLTGGLLGAPRDLVRTLGSMVQPPNHHAWIAFPCLVLAELAAVGTPRLFANAFAGLSRPLRWSLYATAAVSAIFLFAMLLVRGAELRPFVYAMF